MQATNLTPNAKHKLYPGKIENDNFKTSLTAYHISTWCILSTQSVYKTLHTSKELTNPGQLLST